jgi:hypothetical protein
MTSTSKVYATTPDLRQRRGNVGIGTNMESLREEIERVRRRIALASRGVIAPSNKRLRRWDFWTMICLCFTAIVTPVEVCFTNEVEYWSALFVINRMVDCTFVGDLILQFFVAYRDDRLGGQIIKSRKLIARRYLRSWFSIDFVSVIPWEVMPVPSKFRVVRMVRLLRLLKLARILKASRMFARYETSISLSYAQRDIMKMGILLAVVAHWLACLWGLADSVERAESTDRQTQTWVTAMPGVKGWPDEIAQKFIESVHDR